MNQYRWLTDLSQQFLDRDYLLPGQTVDQRVDVIVNRAEQILGKPGFAAKFKSYFQNGWYSLSTPIWSNYGTDRGLPISCFGSHVDDSMEGILKTHAEVGMMTKYGGGTSGHFGDLRGRGSKIRQNGESSGSVHFMQMFDKLITVVSQGSTRRGQFAAYLPIDHPDIMEFLTIRSEGSPIQDLSTGVSISNAWMEAMIAGDAEKRKVWARVLESRANTGYPYLFFSDNANDAAPDVYRDKGMKITHSNLCCVTGDQRVVSDRGMLTAKELHEQGGELTLFDGRKEVKASEMKLVSPKEKVYAIKLGNGMVHKVTACHKVQTDKGMVRTDELKPGDKVAIQNRKGVFGKKSELSKAIIAGIVHSNKNLTEDTVAYVELNLKENKVPSWLWGCDEETQWEFVKHFHGMNSSALTTKADFLFELHAVNESKSFLEDIQLLLANLGVNSSVVDVPEKAHKFELVVKDQVSAGVLQSALGRRVDGQQEAAEEYCVVLSVEYVGEEPVYCCQVHTDEHVWTCNGVITSNSEIMLPDNDDESFVCDLSSMNALYFDEWKDTDAVETMAYFLDSVMTEFIEKARGIPYMERAVRFAERHRALGIGVLGYHSYLQSKLIPFESLEARGHNVRIFRTIQEQALAGSRKMAAEYGEPDVLIGYGRRNTTVTAIAPTKSSAFILGQVSEGIEPARSNYYIKDLQKGKYTIKNPYLEQLLKEKGMDTPEVWESILKRSGSVQHLEFLSEREKGVFKTFVEISPREIVAQAAARQKHIDQGQSLNLMIHPSVPVRDVNALVIEGWRGGVKSFYYQISVNAAQEFSRSIMDCASCSA